MTESHIYIINKIGYAFIPLIQRWKILNFILNIHPSSCNQMSHLPIAMLSSHNNL